MERIRPADVAWGALVGGIIAYDALGDQTMSERFDEYLEHPLGKYVAMGSAAIIGYHLFNLPEHFGTPDPVTEVADLAVQAYEWVTERVGNGQGQES